MPNVLSLRFWKPSIAGCLQLIPIKSHYVWDGKITRDNEVLILIKAKCADYDDLAACIRAAHTYDVPEIVRLDIAAGERSYLDWIASVTRAPDRASPDAQG